MEGEFFHVSPTEAEIVKYAKNSFYAMKVIFGNHFQRLSNNLEQDWGIVKSIITHPQERGIVDSHLDEIDGKMGFGGSCLPKTRLPSGLSSMNWAWKQDCWIQSYLTTKALSSGLVAILFFS